MRSNLGENARQIAHRLLRRKGGGFLKDKPYPRRQSRGAIILRRSWSDRRQGCEPRALYVTFQMAEGSPAPAWRSAGSDATDDD
jgi:hypothetical protein